MTLEGIRIALNALRSNKLRTFLTLLGNIVGTMAVIAVVSLLDGIDLFTRAEIAAEGSNVVTVTRIDQFEALTDLDKFIQAFRHNPQLEWEDFEALADRFPADVERDVVAGFSATVRAGERSIRRIGVEGRSEGVMLLENIKLAAGRGITPLEVRRRKGVVVIGSDIAETLFPGADPVGETMSIAGRHFRVIGVGEPRSARFGMSRDRFIIIPITTFEKTFGRAVNMRLKFRATTQDLVPELSEELRFVMRTRHRLKPSQADDFAITTSERFLSIWEGISQSIFRALVGLASISLVVGGVVLMNVMLVAVTERTREVGLRKALGARRSDILMQFLAESITLSVIGGLLGVTLGFTIAATISFFSPLPSAVKPWPIVAGLGVTLVIGIVFGTYPANRAALLDPVEALRHE